MKGTIKRLYRRAFVNLNVHLEFNEMNVVSRVFFRDIRSHLLRYRVFRLLPSSMIEIPSQRCQSEIFAYQNVICIREDLLEGRNQRAS